jgi:hypothetical protein
VESVDAQPVRRIRVIAVRDGGRHEPEQPGAEQAAVHQGPQESGQVAAPVIETIAPVPQALED